MRVCTGQGLSAQSRAQQLADVAVAVYMYNPAAGSGIHLPLEASNPLLAILKQALDKDDSEHGVGQTLAGDLLESVLQAVDTEADSFPPLIVGPKPHNLLQFIQHSAQAAGAADSSRHVDCGLLDASHACLSADCGCTG